MRLLLDTCTFLWVITGSARLPAHLRASIADPAAEVYVSVVSAWEIALKWSRQRLVLAEPPDRLVPAQRRAHGLAELPLDEASALHLTRLPPLHADPFDRMLVSQAIVHGLVIATPDELVAQYPARTVW
ncbi:MAG: type II toxin-antitoxin system VapC family toxin [Acidobacteria bacterium]|nr:type II toxin-antitoxin system VapC family toxin [Acidobacteriota bacterium]